MTTDEIQGRIKKSKDKLAGYKDISFKSDALAPLYHIPALLPAGTWLKTFNIQKIITGKESHWSAELSGFAFAEDPNQEMRMANDVVVKIKKSKELGGYFKSVTLTSLRQQEVDGQTVVYFVISCM